jgi:hypothetical protein
MDATQAVDRLAAGRETSGQLPTGVTTKRRLELTLELLRQHDWPAFAEPEPLPPDVVRFWRRRPRRPADA